MFNIMTFLDNKLGVEASSIREILYEFSCKYCITKEELPSSDDLMELFIKTPVQDFITLNLNANEDFYCVTKENVKQIDKYEEFVDNIFDDSTSINLEIKIKKELSNSSLNIYNLNAFQNFFKERSVEENLANFTELFKKCGEHINFRLLDTSGYLSTYSIVFSDKDNVWGDSGASRVKFIKNCNDACVFLNSTQFSVVPQDFMIQNPVDSDTFKTIIEIFQKLERVLSFIYLANTSSIYHDKVVLSFNPVASGCEYDSKSMTSNNIISQIYYWVFENDNCVDKANIARNIINAYCRTKEEILSIDQKIFNSIISDFQIYQMNHVEQYIQMKNKISDYIIDSVKQIKELSYELSDAIKNNFVAILVFVMTVILTDSIDITSMLHRNVSYRIAVVCGLFTVSSLLYMCVTFTTSDQKWKWLKQSYEDLKENYKKVLVDDDIEEAFSHDIPLKHAEEQYASFKKNVKTLWVITILVMSLFTVIFCGISNIRSTQPVDELVAETNGESEVEGMFNERPFENKVHEEDKGITTSVDLNS